MSFVNNLKLKRSEKGLSQLELARLTGIAPSHISNLERGIQWPYPGWKKRIAEALCTTEEELFPERQEAGDTV